MTVLDHEERIRGVLRSNRRVAVLGASLKPERAGYFVASYLHRNGYEIFPVNPAYAGRRLEGRPFASKLSDLDEPVDVVDVFRRAEALAGHLEEILAMTPRPSVVWFQPGARDDRVSDALVEAGFDVVQDRCMLAEHRRLL